MPKPEEYTRIEQILDNSAYSGYKQSLSDPAAMQKRIHDLQIELARLKTLPESKSDYTHHNGTSLLMLAARQNAAFAIGPLLDFKADMNEHTRDNVTAIMLAVRHGNIETTKMLFDSGAKVDDLFKKVFPQKITPHNMRVVETTKGTSLASPDSYVSAFDRILLKGNLMMLLLLKDKFTQELAPLKKEEVKANPLVEKLALIDERINRVFREQGPEQKGVKSPSIDKVMESVQYSLRELLAKTNAYPQPQDLVGKYKKSLDERRVPVEITPVATQSAVAAADSEAAAKEAVKFKI